MEDVSGQKHYKMEMYGNVKNTARVLKYITLSGLKTGRDALVDGTWVERLSKWLH